MLPGLQLDLGQGFVLCGQKPATRFAEAHQRGSTRSPAAPGGFQLSWGLGVSAAQP